MSDSFVSASSWEALRKRMASLGIREADLDEKFTLGSGSGGQKINKTSSCVQLRHAISGFGVKTQASRSREVNRYAARRELCDRVEERRLGEKSARRMADEKVRRQKRRRSRRQKDRMLEQKHAHSEKKTMRRHVGNSD